MPHLYHSVYFWLRDTAEAGDVQRLADGCRSYLSAIPGIVTLNVAVPAGTPEARVDNSYRVALLIEFASKEAAAVYEDHPDHQRFVADFGPLLSQVKIYDAVPA